MPPPPFPPMGGPPSGMQGGPPPPHRQGKDTTWGFVLKTMKKIEENYVSIQFLPFNQIYWIFKKFDMFASLRQQS